MQPETTPDATLAALLPEVASFEFGPLKVSVRELVADEWPAIVEDFKPLVELFVAGSPLTAATLTKQLIGPACAVAEATTGIPAATWRKAGGSKLAPVVLKAVQLNHGFFVHGLELLATFGGMLPKAGGPTPSPTSQVEATPSR